MSHKLLFVERKPFESVSIEKAFKQIAANLSGEFEVEFQQVPYGNRFSDTLKNLLFFRKRPADLYHITGQIHYIALLFRPENTVLSIMDVRFLYGKAGARRWLLKKLYLDWPVDRLRYITAISEKTKEEIIKYSGCSPDKVTVLDLPQVIEIDEQPPLPFNSETPVILQVGTMENKNIPNLARALNGLTCKLRVIGNMTGGQFDVLKENGIEYENAFDLSEDELREEYRSADLIAFCSTFEGFGLPIIEAQSMRKPVITSNLSPMIETSGGAAYLADPFDVSSIREGIEKIISDVGYRERLIQDGLENVKRFEAAVVARQYEEYYDRIIADLSRQRRPTLKPRV
jgi:glycosyltransferase involved in cell wall biosynthesis